MMAKQTPDRASYTARARAHKSWANTSDPAARTAPARRRFEERFERQIDPDGVLPPQERARRAAHLRAAYYLDLAERSAKARRERGRARGRGAGDHAEEN
jgi:hypothetical protein